MICCWSDDPNSDALKSHLPRIYDYFWLAEDGMKAQVKLCCVLSRNFISLHFIMVETAKNVL
jgi:hypothetical protein